MKHYRELILNYIENNYTRILREPDGLLQEQYLVPGACYKHSLWDWDSWLTDVAITQVAYDNKNLHEFFPYQKGCIINFLQHMEPETGWTPITISPTKVYPDFDKDEMQNAVKPVLVQHALFVCKYNEDFSWIEPYYEQLKKYLQYYMDYCLHESGLFFFMDDGFIGVDNDPCTFYRPRKSSASIYLNCLMYKELLALASLAKQFEKAEDEAYYLEQAELLKEAVRTHCYDERNGFYYSVDLDLLPIDPEKWLHKGAPRHWNTLIRKIDVWSGFLAMWSGIADEKQAERMVKENYLNEAVFNAPYGVRTLSKCEKMYRIIKSGNPSCWLGPIWGVSNYFVFRALLNYGYEELAEELANKMITLFGRDIEECGEMHEYYDPETGVGVNNQGFQSWNLLCANVIAWMEKRTTVSEV